MLQPESIAVASGRPARTHRAPVNTPIVLSAPFHHGPDDNYYLRQGSSDTIRSLEEAIGDLEGGKAVAFASGMAAIAAVVEGQPAGTIAVVPREGYNVTGSIFAAQAKLGRMTVREVDVTDTDEVLAALPGATLVWLESPTNRRRHRRALGHQVPGGPLGRADGRAGHPGSGAGRGHARAA